MRTQVYKSQSEVETKQIGGKLAKLLKPGDIVYLYGDLGYGKTTFVKGVAHELGFVETIISPTFVVIRSHTPSSSTNPITSLNHIDLYRLENEKQVEEIGLSEILEEKASVKILEWPERTKIIPKKRWDVIISLNKDNTRTIKMINHE